LSAYFDIYNVFDRHYTSPAGSASTTFVGMPQQTRSLMFTLHYQFK
jgi:outer membrane receptor for ferric coprogen and ferric-rhodotorulic acid